MQNNFNNSINQEVKLHDIKLETFIIGACFYNKQALNTVMTLTKLEYIYNPTNQNIFLAIKNLADINQEVDFITVLEELKKNGIDDIPFSYLADCLDSILSLTNLEKYINILRALYIRRLAIETSHELIASAYNFENDIAKLIDIAEMNTYKLTATNSATKEINSLSSLVNENFEEMSKALEMGAEYHNKTLTPTKYNKLDDNLNGGLSPSDLIILAARPAMGKTSFVLNLLLNISKQGYTTAFFSLEMSKEQVTDRLISLETNLFMQKIKAKSLNMEEFEKFYLPKLPSIKDHSLYIDDTSYDLNTIKSKLRKLKAKNPDLRLVAIDYLQIMDIEESNKDNANQAYGKITKSLKRLAKELGITIILLSQLSRAVEQRGNKRPMLSDLRDSGSIESDADIVWFIYRDEYYNPNSDKKRLAEILVSKHRNGPVGNFELFFDAPLTKFQNLEDLK